MYVTFDIGGTNTRVAVCRSDKTISDTRLFRTPESFQKTVDLISETARSLLSGVHPTAVAGGIAAVFDHTHTTVRNTAHLSSDWIGKPVLRALQERFNVPVYLENDTAVAGLGEAHFGAGKGHPIVAYMTISTGIGGVRIVDGKIDRSVVGFEPGHQIVLLADKPFELEDIASGSGLTAQFGKQPADIQDPSVWDRTTRSLAIGIYNTILHWSPSVVVLGGGLIREKRISIDRIRIEIQNMMHIFPEVPSFIEAQLDNENGLYGALALIAQKDRTL